MDETWIVNGNSADEVIHWLNALADEARRRQSEEPSRPQTAILHAGEIDLHRLPLPVRSRAVRGGGIYAQRPAPGRPFGRLHLLALVEEVEGKAVRVEIASNPGFALRGDEVRQHLMRHFPRVIRGAEGRRTGLLLRINQEAESDHTGAPVLACNVWLEEQLAHLGDKAEKRKLFRPWMDRYRALRGIDPADPARSFRAAVAGCEERLLKRGIRLRNSALEAKREAAGKARHRTTTRKAAPERAKRHTPAKQTQRAVEHTHDAVVKRES
jgi:hypothetical protein